MLLILNQIQGNIETDNTITVQLHIFFHIQLLHTLSLLCCNSCACVCTLVCMCDGVLCAAESIDFHRDMTQAPLHLFTPFLNLLHTHSHPITHTHTHSPPTSLPVHRATASLSRGLCYGATGECHLTNEFLLTSLSPLKNLFVFLQQHAALPCSCLCSQTQVLVIYTCAVSTLATCISCSQTESFLPYFFSNVLWFTHVNG